MTDVILAPQIAALINQAGDLVMSCCDFMGRVLDAPDDVKEVRNEVAAFQNDIRSLESFVLNNSDEFKDVMNLSSSNGTLETAKSIIDDLAKYLDLKRSFPPAPAKLGRFQLDKMMWLMKSDHIHKFLDKLKSCRESVNLTLTTLLTKQVKKIENEVTQIGCRLTDQEKRRILAWFHVNDSYMRTMHANKRLQYEQNTCEWMHRNPEWAKWLSGPRCGHGHCRYIHIEGIPGAGKTVLASYLIEKSAEHCRSLGSTYYYCHYTRAQDETIPLLQRTIKDLMGQLAISMGARYIPKRMRERYDVDTELDTQDLLACLEDVSCQFEDGVRIIVDALDESRGRDNLLRVLITIGTDDRFRNVSLLTTSRIEPDIVESVQKLGHLCTIISMANPDVRADIRKVVHSELTKRHWTPKFTKEVEDKLVNGSKGMFRWVACQLDLLKRLEQRYISDEQVIRGKLQDLPDDIFKTYERILLEIPEDHKEFARTALALICSKSHDIPTAEILVEASLHYVPYGNITKYNVAALSKICGCLINVNALNKTPDSVFNRDNEGVVFSRVSLAHYTVKEYLFHPDTAKGPAKFFALEEKNLKTVYMTVVFNGLSHFRPGGGTAKKDPVTRFDEFCLQETERFLRSRERACVLDNDKLTSIVISSLKPCAPHAAFLKLQRGISRVMRDYFSTWNAMIHQLEIQPLGEAEVTDPVGVLVNLVHLRWNEMAERYLEHSDIKGLPRRTRDKLWTTTFKFKGNEYEHETLLMLCVRKRLISFLELFTRKGAYFDEESEILFAAMYDPYRHNSSVALALRMLRTMLDLGSGAKPDPTPSRPGGRYPPPEEASTLKAQFAFTPLQVATVILEYDLVEALLDGGANPNGVGTRNGQIPHDYHDNPDGPDCKYLCKMGLKTPLDICRLTQPPWANPGEKEALVASKRCDIERLLKRWGAEEPEDSEDSESGEVDGMDIDRELIDLTS
ncbi:uncharacterized protein JN550_010045 [Neoarthrinium moseri]|uniref:uncharacterized protein n=1 Tax=Neoarthrinium moseri TaxID=1658444 RepID=UPI001FDDD99B|nr:uncharacterized protein JN550_010045 [Neoarthrinium moseri]KAI1862708.1 hypothetical protein JN550_010045 [Neoarthrinium moseri]